MDNFLAPVERSDGQAITAPINYSAPNGNQFFGSVGAVNSNAYFIGDDGVQHQIQLSTEYCNLFIIKDEQFNGHSGSFIIPKKMSHHYEKMGDSAKNEISTYPSLFMDINDEYRRCLNVAQQFYYGLVTKVYEQGKTYKIHYQKMSVQPLYQKQLNDHSVELGININDGYDVLVETRWIIKRMDLRRALMGVGIYL